MILKFMRDRQNRENVILQAFYVNSLKKSICCDTFLVEHGVIIKQPWHYQFLLRACSWLPNLAKNFWTTGQVWTKKFNENWNRSYKIFTHKFGEQYCQGTDSKFWTDLKLEYEILNCQQFWVFQKIVNPTLDI